MQFLFSRGPVVVLSCSNHSNHDHPRLDRHAMTTSAPSRPQNSSDSGAQEGETPKTLIIAEEEIIGENIWPPFVRQLVRAIVSAGGPLRMKEALERTSCWFNYYSEDPECSPYEGVVRSLKRSRASIDGWGYVE